MFQFARVTCEDFAKNIAELENNKCIKTPETARRGDSSRCHRDLHPPIISPCDSQRSVCKCLCRPTSTNLPALLLCLSHCRRAGQLVLHLLRQTHTQETLSCLSQFTAHTHTKPNLAADGFIIEILCHGSRIAGWQIKMSQSVLFLLN